MDLFDQIQSFKTYTVVVEIYSILVIIILMFTGVTTFTPPQYYIHFKALLP